MTAPDGQNNSKFVDENSVDSPSPISSRIQMGLSAWPSHVYNQSG